MLLFHVIPPRVVAMSEGLTANFSPDLYFVISCFIPRRIGGILNDLTQSTVESFYRLLLIELRACQGENLKTRDLIKSKHLSLYRPVMCFAFNPETVANNFLIYLFLHVPNRSETEMLYPCPIFS